jgi:exodeoxyribonuclease V gamma subunit
LQPFDARNFTSGAIVPGGPFSFDQTALAGAVAASGDRPGEQPFLPVPLPPLDGAVVELSDLRAFLDHPVRAFTRRRLGAGFSGNDDEPADGLPVELDALQRWSVGERMLRSLLKGVELDRCVQAEWRRGVVPPGPLGGRLLDAIAAEVQPLADAAMTCLDGAAEAVDVTVTLPDGRRLIGTVNDVYGSTVVAVSYSKISPKHRLRAWLNLLALTTSRPGVAWRAVTIGRGSRSTVGPIDAATATDALAGIVALADKGLCEPLPLALRSSYAYAQCRLAGGDPHTACAKARAEWTRFSGGGEADDPAHRLVWGPQATLERLLEAPAAGGAEPTRFGVLAMRLWEPLWRTETTGPI